MTKEFPGVPFKAVRTDPRSVSWNTPLSFGTFVFFNTQIPLHETVQGHVYLIQDINISCNVSQLDFTQALNPAINQGRFSIDIIRTLDNNRKETADSFNFSQFTQTRRLTLAYEAIDEDETINLQLNGSLLQTASIVAQGITTLNIFMDLTLYEINDPEWKIKNYYGNPSKERTNIKPI